MMIDELSEMHGLAKRKLHGVGLNVKQLEDFSQVHKIAQKIEKPYMTGYLDPLYNDFFSKNSFWLIAYNLEGDIVGMVGVRRDVIGTENLHGVYRRRMMMRNNVLSDDNVPKELQPRCADEMTGTLVYVGDLFFGKRARGFGTQYLPDVLRLVFLTALMKWQDLDWFYAFLEEKNARRGVSSLYGFLRCYPFANSWTVNPMNPEFTHSLMCMTQDEFIGLLGTELAAKNLELEPQELDVTDGAQVDFQAIRIAGGHDHNVIEIDKRVAKRDG